MLRGVVKGFLLSVFYADYWLLVYLSNMKRLMFSFYLIIASLLISFTEKLFFFAFEISSMKGVIDFFLGGIIVRFRWIFYF